MSPAFTVRPARWDADENAIARLRRAVFIEEQGVPEALEWEARDGECLWFLAFDGLGAAIGVARVTPEGRIGRMAVAPSWRRRGVGGALLQAAIQAARAQGHGSLRLSAQTHAMPFYERHGFVATGAAYLDAGIPHRTMILGVHV